MADLFSKPVDEITYQDLSAFAHTQPIEGERLDWKKELTSSRVTETIVAMYNTQGGLILLGVDEDKRAGDGTKRMAWPPRSGVRASALDAIMSMCRSSYRPPDYLPKYQLIEIPHLPSEFILVLRVDQQLAPMFLWHLEEGFLSRIGDQNRPSTPEATQALLKPKRDERQDLQYQESRGFTTAKDGVLQQLIVAIRYPRGASIFGTEQKKILQRAVGTYFGRDADPDMDAKYESVSFDLNIERLNEKVAARFTSLGVARISVARPWATAIGWRWLIGEAMLAVECLQSNEVGSVYPSVREGDLALILTNWPDRGIDTDGLPLPSRASSQSMKGHTVLREFVLEPTTNGWGLVRVLVENALGDAGCLEHEKVLDDFEKQLDTWMVEYRRGTLRPTP